MTTSPQLLVSQYMKKYVVTASSTTPLREVIRIMIDNKTNGLVVVDEERKVIGILSGLDVIQHVVPDYLEDDRHLAPFTAAHRFAERISLLADDPISLFMTMTVYTVTPDDSLMKAATLLSENRIRQLPVVGQNDVLVGYINRTDIKHAIGDVLFASD